MIHIRLITPHINDRSRKLQSLSDLRNLSIDLSMVHLDTGPSSIESEFDEALATPYVLGRAIEAEQDGVHALVIDCMGDPGLDACREVVNIPVIGPGETAMHTAAMLGRSFSFITVLERIRPMIEKRARIYGVTDRIASIRAVDIPVLSIEEKSPDLVDRLLQESLIAVTQDRADVIILGCTGFEGLAETLALKLKEAGQPIPVIDPVRTAVLIALTWVRSGLSHSPLTYPGPRDKPIRGYGLPPSPKLG